MQKQVFPQKIVYESPELRELKVKITQNFCVSKLHDYTGVDLGDDDFDD